MVQVKHLLQKKDEKEKASKYIKGGNIDFDIELFEKLKQYRYKIAQEKGLPPYVIFHDIALKEMAAYLPVNKESFLEIKGVGEKKYENYGEGFIDIINGY